jgi:ABC-2 type transport system permease protein
MAFNPYRNRNGNVLHRKTEASGSGRLDVKQNQGHTVFSLITLFFYYLYILAKVNLEYRSNTLTLGFAVFCREIVNIAIIYFMFLRFETLNGWQFNELIFLYSFLFLTYSLVTFFFTGIRDFESLVYEGDFDRYLCRPVNPLFQVIISKSDYAATIGHGAIGIVLFIICASKVGIEWNIMKIIYLIPAIIGGVLIQASIFLLSASLSFWTIRSTNIRNMVFFNMRRIAGFPATIFSSFVRILVVYVIPFAFVNYFPVQFFLRKQDLAFFPWYYIYLTPFVGILCIGIALGTFSLGIRRYASVGN